jgi:hypothetical protein
MSAVRDFYADLGVQLPARGGRNVQVRCFANPAAHRHDDRRPSCSINTEDGRWYCHACGEGGNAYQAVVRLRGIEGREVYGFLRQYGLADEAPRQRGGRHPSERRAYVHRSSSEGGADGSGGADLTVEAYARAKGLPPEFLRSLGVSDYMDNRLPPPSPSHPLHRRRRQLPEGAPPQEAPQARRRSR